jgi:hypothetical protein
MFCLGLAIFDFFCFWFCLYLYPVSVSSRICLSFCLSFCLCLFAVSPCRYRARARSLPSLFLSLACSVAARSHACARARSLSLLRARSLARSLSAGARYTHKMTHTPIIQTSAPKMGTLSTPLSREDAVNAGIVKVVADQFNRALYFSRRCTDDRHMHTHAHAYTYMHASMLTHAYTYTHKHAHTHANTQTSKHTRTRTRAQAHTRTRIHTIFFRNTLRLVPHGALLLVT